MPPSAGSYLGQERRECPDATRLTQSRLSSFGNTLCYDALDPTDHHLHRRFVRQLLTAERSPREKIDRVPECSGEKLSSLVATGPSVDEDSANTLAVGNAAGCERPQTQACPQDRAGFSTFPARGANNTRRAPSIPAVTALRGRRS